MLPTARWVSFGRGAATVLRDELALAQAVDPMAPATVIVARSPIGLGLRRLLASGDLGASPVHGRTGLVNVRFTTFARLADQLGSVRVAEAGRRPLASASLRAAVEVALRTEHGRLLGAFRDHPATVAAVMRAYRELRGLDDAACRRLAAQSPRAAEVVAVVDRVRHHLGDWYDDADLGDAAVAAVDADPKAAAALLGPVVVHLPLAITDQQQALLAALAAHVPVTVLLGWTGDPGADTAARELADRFELAPPAPGGVEPAGTPRFAHGVLNAPSPDAEVLLAVRSLLDRRAAGVPFERMAIVHADIEPYPRLVHETLGLTGVPFNGSAVRPLAATLVGRTLLGAFALVDRDWRRDDVMAWLAGAPILDRDRPAPATAWDRVSRRAGITAGLDTWRAHLRGGRQRLEDALARLPAGTSATSATTATTATTAATPGGDTGGRDPHGGDPAGVGAPGIDIDIDERRRTLHERLALLESLEAFFETLVGRLVPVVAPSTWAEWSAWAEGVLATYLGDPAAWAGWPDAEVEAARTIGDVIRRLSGLDDLDPAPDRVTFQRALVAELEAPAPSTARFGTGVFVGPLSLAVGLDLDVTFVVGMSETAYPGRRREDSLLPDHERAAAGADLAARSAHAHDSHRDYLAVLASSTEVVLSFARGDQRSGREQRPSRWLLDTLGHLEGGGRRLYSRDLDALGRAADAGTSFVPGYQFISSHTAAVRRAGEPASLSDHDLRSLLDWRERTGALDGHPLLRHDAVLRLGTTTRRQRRARRFTRFDGLIVRPRESGEERAGRAAPQGVVRPRESGEERAGAGGSAHDAIPSLSDGGALSPTSLQTYAECPRRYLLAQVLRLRAVERPEAILRIGAAERGSLMHDVLERFIGRQLALPRHERIRPDTAWSAEDHEHLDEITQIVCAEYEHQGLTGRPLLWQLDQQSIRRDLHSFLESDDRYRATYGAVPERVEFAFGPQHERPVTVDLPSGRRLGFKGFADRVDLADDGSIIVLDYKTGSSRNYGGLDDDPVSRGRLLQLPIYGLAARRHIGPGPVRSAYWFVSEKGGFAQVGYDLDQARLDRFRDVLDVVVDGIEAGHFPAHPGERNFFSFENCAYCDFQQVCPRDRDHAWQRVRTAPELSSFVRLAEGGEDDPVVEPGTRLDLQIGAGPDLGLVGGRAPAPGPRAGRAEPADPADPADPAVPDQEVDR